MRKGILVLFVLLMISCKTAIPEEKTASFYLSDSWLLTKISFVDPNVHEKFILFNDATNQCFKDSRWNFNAATHIGTYAINDLYCSYGKRNLSFRFLKTEEKTGHSHIVLEAKNKAGKSKLYRIKITELSKHAMQWNYVVYVKNKRYTINMQFEKA